MQNFQSFSPMNDDHSAPSFFNFESLGQVPGSQSYSHFDECIHSLEKSASERTAHDYEIISNTLKQFEYFSKQASTKNDHALLEFAKTINYEYFHKDRVVFHKDDTNDRIYLILSGSVVLFNQIATDVFQIETQAEKEPEEQDLIKEVVPVKSLLKRNTVDENLQRDLFQPRMSRKIFRRMTSVLDTNSAINNKMKSQVPPTVEEIKRYLHDHHGESPSHGHIENPESPWAMKEARKKLLMYKLLLRADREKAGKYTLDGKLLFDIKKKISPGSHFGEMNSKLNKFKEVTAIAAEELRLISFRVGDYTKFFNQLPNNANHLRFLAPYFPEASYPKLLKLTDLFEECSFKQKNVVYEEEAEVDCLYLIKEGEIQLMKRIDLNKIETKEPLSPSFKKKYNIASLGAGEVFGEDEFFFDEESRQYSAVVTSGEAVLLKLDVEKYKRMNETYKELFNHMKKAAKARKVFHREQSQNVFNQVANSIQQHDDFKLSLKRIDSTPKQRASHLRKNSLPRVPENNRAASPNKSLSGSPTNKLRLPLAFSPSDSPSKEGSPKAGKAMQKFPTSPQKLPKSPQNFPVMTEPYHNERSFSPSPDPEDFRKSMSPLQARPRIAHQGRTTINSDMPWADKQLSLYTKAVGHVKKKRVTSQATPNPRQLKVLTKNSSEHKLYFSELEKSVQSASKIELKEIQFGEQGFVSMQGSPIARMQSRNESSYHWDSILFHKKSLHQPSPSNTDAVDASPSKHRLSKILKVESKTKLPKFIHSEHHSFNKTVKHEGNSFSPTKNLNTTGGWNQRTDSSPVPELCKIEFKPDQILSTYEAENPNIVNDRKGFKPSPVKSGKLKFIQNIHIKNATKPAKMPTILSNKTPKQKSK